MKEIVKKWGLFSIVLLLSMVMITGCGTQEQSTQDKEGAASNNKKKNSQNNEEAISDHDHRRCESRGNH